MEGHARVSIASGSAIGRWESRDQRHPFSTARERTSTALYGPSAPAASVRAASIYARRPMHVGQKVCASMNAHTRSIASKTIPPRLCMAMVLSALVWLGGPRSADAGVDVWTPTGPPSGTILALAIDPQNPATLYAAVSRDSVFPNSAVTGVFKSTDGGATWGATGLTLPTRSLAIDPQTPTTLYAGAGGPTDGGVFKSIDGGASWTAVNTGLTDLVINALAVDPRVSTTVYAGTSRGGIFKSTDGGGTWSAVNAGLRPDRGPSGWPSDLSGHPSVLAFAIDTQTSSTIYTGISFSGVFKSSDGGGSWRGVGPTIADVRAITVDPEIPTTLYLGTALSGVFRSTDGGGSWVGITPTLMSVLSASQMAIDPRTAATLYAALPPLGGVFRSADGGESWSRTGRPNSRDPSSILALAIDPRTPTTLYVGGFPTVADSGVFKSTDGGATWPRVRT